MMMKNEKGFTGLEIAGIVALGMLVITTVLPLVGINLTGGQGKQSTQKSVTTIIPATGPDGKPVYVKDAAGNVGPLMRQEITTLDEETTPKVPIWKRILALGWIWVILMVLGMFFPPVAALMAWINHKISTGADQLEGDAKKIVHSVEAGLKTLDDPKLRQAFLDEMSKVQDSTTKALVAELKRV